MSYIDEISARINQVIDHFSSKKGKQNVSGFSRLIDFRGDTLSTYIGKKGDLRMPGAEFISILVEKLGISSDWILLGRGEMLEEKTYHVTQIYEPEIQIVQTEFEQAKKLIGTLQKTLDIINHEFSKANEELEALRIENSRLKNMLADKQYHTGSNMVAETPPELDKNSNKK